MVKYNYGEYRVDDYKELATDMINNYFFKAGKLRAKLYDLPEGEDRVIQTISNILTKLDIKSAKFLGAGSYGCAFAISNDVVVKFTADQKEIKIASTLQGKKLENVAKYYKVYKSKSLNIGIILLKKYNQLPEYIDDTFMYRMFKNAYRLYTLDYDDLSNEYKQQKQKSPEESAEFDDVVNHIAKMVKYTKHVNEDIVKMFFDIIYMSYKNLENQVKYAIEYAKNIDLQMLQFCIDAVTALAELKENGVNWGDDHWGNFAVDSNGRYIAIDIGYSDTDADEGDIIVVEKDFSLMNIFKRFI